MKYKLLSGKHGRFEDGAPIQYKVGDLVELTPEEAASLARRVELWGKAVPEPVTVAPEPKAVAPPVPVTSYGLAGLHWSKAASLIAGLKTVAEVEAAIAEETAGKARKRVLAAGAEKLATMGSE